MLALAGCGDDPIVIFRVKSSAASVSANIQVCEASMTGTGMCSGMPAQVLGEGDTTADGALFDVPSGIAEVPVQVFQGGTVGGCTRTIVPIADAPVELTINVGGSVPVIDCPSGVTCRADGCCLTSFGGCVP